MVSYIEKLFPFLDNSEFVKNTEETVNVSDIYCPIDFSGKMGDTVEVRTQSKPFKACKVTPCDVIVIDENDTTLLSIMRGEFGTMVNLNITEYDYSEVAQRIDASETEAFMKINSGYLKQEIASDFFINSASNFSKVSKELVADIVIPYEEKTVDFNSWMTSTESKIDEAVMDDMDDLENSADKGEQLNTQSYKKIDEIYSILNAYFASPEGLKSNGREVVPLLIGPTGVFKSATIKELCGKFGYRLVDFRAAFTSRLDYSGLYEMGKVDNEVYSYSCPMEELVVCSDGFREYCNRAIARLEGILKDGSILQNKSSNGESDEGTRVPLTEEQIEKINATINKYKDYAKPVCLFVDEITRVKDTSVNGILTEMLNQKRFNNMTMYGCKFVAATNANIATGDREHDMYIGRLDDMYDVNTELDIAFSNRFLPLVVKPMDVAERWFEWAKDDKKKHNPDGSPRSNIHPIVLKFFDEFGTSWVYNDEPVINAIKSNLSDNEIKSQTYPNYRTWDMLSGYLYKIDENYQDELQTNADAKRVFRRPTVEGLISKWGAEQFIPFLEQNDYYNIESVKGPVNDEYTDFLESSLDAGVPALMIGPSSMGKTTRVKSYIRKQEQRGKLKPILINIDMASKDAVDLMGMPTKISLLDYVGGESMKSDDMQGIASELKGIIKSVVEDDSFGLTDKMTLRAPDRDIKDKLEKAKREGREVIFFFDECNRVKSTTIMSAMFEVISDARFAGVNFAEMKDKVKVVAACNMGHAEMDMGGDLSDADFDDNVDANSDNAGYSGAGSLDPALAARFSVYWKKKYDEKDVDSWIEFMEREVKEGNIDGILLEFFKTLPKEEAVKVMASVEKRQLAYATPSTRNMHQLSMDIKSFRCSGSDTTDKLFYGKVICDSAIRAKVTDFASALNEYSPNVVDIMNLIIPTLEDVVSQKDVWDAVVSNKMINFGGKDRNAIDLMDTLEGYLGEFKQNVIKPLSTEDANKLMKKCRVALQILNAIEDYDDNVSNGRRGVFEKYLGDRDSAFVVNFTNFFNANFGTDSDTDITLEMLSDVKLDRPYFKKFKSVRVSLTGEQYISASIDLIKKFKEIHGLSLQPIVYATFLEVMKDYMPSPEDDWRLLLGRCGKEIDDLFARAEEVGDEWVAKMIGGSSLTTIEDIQNMREAMGNAEVSTKRQRKTVVI